MTAPSRRSRRGLTLIESIAAIVVLGISIPPFLALFREVATKSTKDTNQAVAIQYANSLMEEIVSKAFEDPNLAAGSFGTEEGTRSAYDDVDDFNGLSDSPPKRIDGSTLSDYAGFTSAVTVANVTEANLGTGTAAANGSTDFKIITVTVSWTGGGGGAVTLKALRTKKAAASSGPLDETASAASAVKSGETSVTLNFISTSVSDVQIKSFSVSTSRSNPTVVGFKLAGVSIWSGEKNAPLATTNLNAGTASDRTIPANTTKQAKLSFDGGLGHGAMTITLVLNYTSGPSDTLSFTINWP
jgi:MSHA pilin protein MshD